jgi:hypothetical protein
MFFFFQTWGFSVLGFKLFWQGVDLDNCYGLRIRLLKGKKLINTITKQVLYLTFDNYVANV